MSVWDQFIALITCNSLRKHSDWVRRIKNILRQRFFSTEWTGIPKSIKLAKQLLHHKIFSEKFFSLTFGSKLNENERVFCFMAETFWKFNVILFDHANRKLGLICVHNSLLFKIAHLF